MNNNEYMFLTEINEKNISDLINDIFLKSRQNNNFEYTLYISSIGGDISSAIRFYDFIQSSGIKINTVGFGEVNSAAIILLLVGQKRFITRKCQFRLHAPKYTGVQQNQLLSVHIETTKYLEGLNRRFYEIINELLPDSSDIQKMCNKGIVIDSIKAKEIGIGTEIIDRFPIKKFHN